MAIPFYKQRQKKQPLKGKSFREKGEKNKETFGNPSIRMAKRAMYDECMIQYHLYISIAFETTNHLTHKGGLLLSVRGREPPKHREI